MSSQWGILKMSIFRIMFDTTFVWLFFLCNGYTKKHLSTLLSHLESSIFSLYLQSTPNWLLSPCCITNVYSFCHTSNGGVWISVEDLEDMHDPKWDKRVDSCFLLWALTHQVLLSHCTCIPYVRSRKEACSIQVHFQLIWALIHHFPGLEVEMRYSCL